MSEAVSVAIPPVSPGSNLGGLRTEHMNGVEIPGMLQCTTIARGCPARAESGTD